MNNIRLDPSKYSVISDHIIDFEHSMERNNVNILDTEANYNKRIISEMLYIKEQSNGINSQKDIEFLDDSYFGIFNVLADFSVDF